MPERYFKPGLEAGALPSVTEASQKSEAVLSERRRNQRGEGSGDVLKLVLWAVLAYGAYDFCTGSGAEPGTIKIYSEHNFDAELRKLNKLYNHRGLTFEQSRSPHLADIHVTVIPNKEELNNNLGTSGLGNVKIVDPSKILEEGVDPALVLLHEFGHAAGLCDQAGAGFMDYRYQSFDVKDDQVESLKNIADMGPIRNIVYSLFSYLFNDALAHGTKESGTVSKPTPKRSPTPTPPPTPTSRGECIPMPCPAVDQFGQQIQRENQ